MKFETKGKPLNGGTSSSPFWVRGIYAICEDGKEGVIKIDICDILGKNPSRDDAEIMMPAFRDWWTKYPQLAATSLTEQLLVQGQIRLTVCPVKKLGFCESVIQAVAGLGKPTGLKHKKWFTRDLKIEQETLVLQKTGEWVKFKEHLARAHPLQCNVEDLVE